MKLFSIRNHIAKALVNVLAANDTATSRHSRNVAVLMYRLSKAMGLEETSQEAAYTAGLVHDIGKMRVPMAILNKPGALTAEEYGLIKEHPEMGVQVLCHFTGFEDIIDVVRSHHERYDGRGYPECRHKEDIPLLSRMLAVCDAFDAMTATRCYRPACSCEDAIAEIQRYAGTQFDPEICQTFLCMIKPWVLRRRAL